MTDVRATGSGAAGCPDFEALSRFADGEAERPEAVSLTSHLAKCERCTELLGKLQIGFGAAAVPSDHNVSGSECVGREVLVAHLTATLAADEERFLKGHLAACDACVSDLSLLHRRLSVIREVDAPVPAGVKARAWAAIGAPAAVAVPRARHEGGSWGRRVERRASAWLRLPVLMPLSLAAGALLMVGIQETGVMSPTPRVLTRSVDREARLRVTVPAADVRQEPHRRAEVIAVVTRGTVVDLAGEDRDWYRVKLSDERLGWVERDAFE